MSDSGFRKAKRAGYALKVIVCGGRDFDAVHIVYRTLDQINPSIVVHGGATGADALAGEWAREKGRIEKCYPADWKKHGRAAGPIRNEQMLKLEEPDFVVAFPGGRGTAHMVKIALEAGIDVIEVMK